jgi:hypothetical protein
MQNERLEISQQDLGITMTNVGAHDSGWKNLSGHHVAGYRVAKGPSESVQVDEDNANDASSRRASHVTVGCCWSSEADIEGQVEHSSSLDRSADEQWKTSSNTAV